MPDYKEIYQNYAAEYDLLVSSEDYEKNLLKALQQICVLNSREVVEFGAGTGRLTQLILPHVKHITAYDNSEAMLQVAREKLSKLNYSNWTLKTADNRFLPVENRTVDIALAGWTFGHMTEWYPSHWKEEISKSINEMFRILKPNGTAIIIETEGTGFESPFKPKENLGLYYQFLEKELNFSFKWIRTDYKFKTIEEAKELTELFFNKTFSFKTNANKSALLPECTGLWWRTV